MKRPYASFLNVELENKINQLVKEDSVTQLELIYAELELRRKPKAKELMTHLKLALESLHESKSDGKPNKMSDFLDSKNFGETLKFWRIYCERSVDSPKREDDCLIRIGLLEEFWGEQEPSYFKLSNGDLKKLELDSEQEVSFFAYFGYRSYKPKKLRKQILHLLRCCSLPKALNYKEWGEPSSEARYLKIIDYLGGFAFPRRHDPKQKVAVANWDEDRKWFETSYLDDIDRPCK